MILLLRLKKGPTHEERCMKRSSLRGASSDQSIKLVSAPRHEISSDPLSKCSTCINIAAVIQITRRFTLPHVTLRTILTPFQNSEHLPDSDNLPDIHPTRCPTRESTSCPKHYISTLKGYFIICYLSHRQCTTNLLGLRRRVRCGHL
jgi:hypothetical protein